MRYLTLFLYSFIDEAKLLQKALEEVIKDPSFSTSSTAAKARQDTV